MFYIKHKHASISNIIACISGLRCSDDPLGNCFFEISSYACACVRIKLMLSIRKTNIQPQDMFNIKAF